MRGGQQEGVGYLVATEASGLRVPCATLRPLARPGRKNNRHNDFLGS